MHPYEEKKDGYKEFLTVPRIRITRVCLSSPNAHIKYLICISVIKAKSPEHFLTFPKGDPRFIFCEYNERVSREPRNSS